MKKILIIISILLLVFGLGGKIVFAYSDASDNEVPYFEDAENQSLSSEEPTEDNFKAKVKKVIEEKEVDYGERGKTIYQKLELIGLEGDYKDKTFQSVDEEENVIFSKRQYKEGDKVIVSHIHNIYGEDKYFVIDYYRIPSLYILAIIFVVLVLLINRFTGLRSLLGLTITILVILFFIIPQIVKGQEPLLIAVIGSVIILIATTYLIYGFNKKSHIAILSIAVCLIIAGIFSLIFTNVSKLTGFAEEETIYLVGVQGININMKGLLLAGVLIVVLGVIDDVVIAQISTVKEIIGTKNDLSRREIYKKAMRVGVDHTSSMVNTLFLAYAGASLSLLVLFSLKDETGLSWQEILNSEFLATEIVRTLIGSIAIAVSVPIATILATYFFKPQTKEIEKPNKFEESF